MPALTQLEQGVFLLQRTFLRRQVTQLRKLSCEECETTCALREVCGPGTTSDPFLGERDDGAEGAFTGEVDSIDGNDMAWKSC